MERLNTMQDEILAEGIVKQPMFEARECGSSLGCRENRAVAIVQAFQKP